MQTSWNVADTDKSHYMYNFYSTSTNIYPFNWYKFCYKNGKLTNFTYKEIHFIFLHNKDMSLSNKP